MPVLDAWYASLDLRALDEETADAKLLDMRRRQLQRAIRSTSIEAHYPKVVRRGRRGTHIKDAPPLVYHFDRARGPGSRADIRRVVERYRESLADDKRLLFDRYELVDEAIKVVGIGSVGRFCGIGLFLAGGEDPLFLQLKEARASVLEPHAGRSQLPSHGERVVVGQRMMQSASDIFLGWSREDGGREFYVRQLRDVKVRPAIESFDADGLARYASICGRALARAHGRSGRAVELAAYLGGGPKFDDAIGRFAVAYAEQNERDHRALTAAVRAGHIAVEIDA
jgi:hypothetical protein